MLAFGQGGSVLRTQCPRKLPKTYLDFNFAIFLPLSFCRRSRSGFFVIATAVKQLARRTLNATRLCIGTDRFNRFAS